MPELVPQTLIMDQQLELPSNWYGAFDSKRDISSPSSPSNPSELLSSLDEVQHEWSFHGDQFHEEPNKGDGLDKCRTPLFSLEDYDDVITGLVLSESAIASQAAAADIEMLGSPVGQDGLCCDGWAELGSAGRTADEDRLCDKSFEDVFQVDSQDILCSPTLAQLNGEHDCSELLEDISNVIVKDEYGSAEATVLASVSKGSRGSSQELHGPGVEHTMQAFSQASSSGVPAVPARCAADWTASVPTSAWNPGDVRPAVGTMSGAACNRVPPAQWPEKRRRLSDSVTLYDLLISKSSPQQLQVMMSHGAAASAAPDRDQQASADLQHKRSRHGARDVAAAVEGRSSPASGCNDSAAATAPAYHVPGPTPREPRGGGRRRSLPAGAALSRARQLSECSAASNYDAPDDEGGDVDDDDDDVGGGDGYTSDAGSCSSCSTWTSSKDGKQRQPQRRRRRSPYFWQYNSQSKGPRGERFELTLAPSDDPHKPVNFTDPVFDPEQHVRIRHVGRARKGDGNDVRPNPRRLVSIGKELAKLNRLMSDVSGPAAAAAAGASAAAAAAPAAAAAGGGRWGDGGAGRPDCKREKNKLASRACRLKKKAQHEANKVKLCGLEQERKELVEVLDAIKTELQEHRAGPLITQGRAAASAGTVASGPCQQRAMQSISLTGLVKELMSRHLVTKVAGRTSQFVSEVVAQVEAGDPLGGLIAED